MDIMGQNTYYDKKGTFCLLIGHYNFPVIQLKYKQAFIF